ncbi:MAG: GNAT family N-acetyltransferase [Verrucomicrobiales bacterium]|nr:GNAT family N-acetyltransferase [Verrucomicrobiales bacterium]
MDLKNVIELRPFEYSDIPRLIGWIPDARFLLQWAGPGYSFPLDAAQLFEALGKTKGTAPSHLMFKALRQPEDVVIGHIELMGIDHKRRRAHMGRVLIGEPKWRGKGYGRQMVKAAIDYAFGTMNFDTITLSVFDFNTRAMAAYEAIGFLEYERVSAARRFGEESWGLVLMRIERDVWMRSLV